MSKLPDPWPSLPGTISDLRDRIERLERRSPFHQTGMRPNGAGGIDSDNFEEGVAGYRFDSSGNAEFNELTLRTGIIGNDALSAPVSPAVGHDDAYNFALTPAWATVCSVTVTVPSGYTQALVMAVGNASLQNPTAGTDYAWAATSIGSGVSPGYSMRQMIPAGQFGALSNACSRLLTGLSGGGTFTIRLDLSSDVASWAASTYNTANVDGTILFLR